MKAVMWTDTVQVIIMFISMAVVGFMRLFLKMFEYFLTIASTVRPNATSIFNRWYLKGTLTKVVVQLYGQQTKLQIAWNLESMLLVYVLSTFQNHILKIYNSDYIYLETNIYSEINFLDSRSTEIGTQFY